MLKRVSFALCCVFVLSSASFVSASTSTINLLSTANAAWSTDVGNSTCVIGPRSSGDSIVATWHMNLGTWSNTWVGLVITPLVSLSGSDSIKIIYEDNDVDGFALRITLKDGTMWQAAAYLNGTGLQGANFPLNVATFPQHKDSASAPDGIFIVDSIKTFLFVSNKNPTVLTSAGANGVLKLSQVLVTTAASSAKPFCRSLSSSGGLVQIASNGFMASKAGIYTVSLFGANGALIYRSTSQCSAGFNKVDFPKLCSGICIAKVTSNGFTATNRLILGK